MKNENFIIIQGWMVNELNLSGHELLTYALIYGFSQDGESEYRGSISYLCKFLNCTRKTAIKVLSNLTESNLITKREIYENNQKFCRYKAIKVPSVDSKLPSGKITPPIVESLHHPSGEFTLPPSGNITPHNTISLDNKDDTNNLHKDNTVVDVEILKTDLEINLEEYVKIRKKMKKPFTDYSYKLMLEKLEEFSKGDENTKIEILKRSIMNNYQGIFELPKTSSTKNQNNQPEPTAYGIPLSNWQEGYDKVKGISISSELKNRNNEANR